MRAREWRFVAERPAGQEGRDLIVAKRDADKAAKALRDWRRDMAERYEPNDLDVWPSHIETREVFGPWRVYPEGDLPTEVELDRVVPASERRER